MIVKFHCNESRQKELTEVVEGERKYMMGIGTFVDKGTGMTISPELIDKGFRLIAPDTLFEDDTLPKIITGFMDKAVYARGFYDDHEIVEAVDESKRPILLAETSQEIDKKGSFTILTKRLILRHVHESDLLDLHRCLSKEAIAVPSGFKPKKNLEESQNFLQSFLDSATQFVICFREDPKMIGNIGLRIPEMISNFVLPGEMEMGTWIDVPYWGKGYMPEAVRALQKYAFEELDCPALWVSFFEGNVQSKRCLEKSGFVFHHTEADKYWPDLDTILTEHFMYLTKEEWLKTIQ